MDIPKLPFIDNVTSQADVYTNLHGLQSIKNEENKSEALMKVAQQFESLFVNMMTKSMRAANAVFEKDSPFNSEESRFYRDMLDQQRSLSISNGRGLGIAEAMYRQMSRSYGIGPESESDGLTFDRNPDRGLHGNTMKDMSSPSFSRTPETTITGKLSTDRTPQDSTPKRISLADSPKEFVAKLLPLAEKAAEKLGIDHLLLVAQSALETGWGKHVLASDSGESSHNVFNVKGRRGGSFATTTQPTIEFKDGVVTTEKSAFNVYKDLAESFDDYVQLITGSERYQNALNPSDDSAGYIAELQKSGYATDPQYSQKVMSVYERVKEFAFELDKTPQNNEASL